jgi:hypothetical protein
MPTERCNKRFTLLGSRWVCTKNKDHRGVHSGNAGPQATAKTSRRKDIIDPTRRVVVNNKTGATRYSKPRH